MGLTSFLDDERVTEKNKVSVKANENIDVKSKVHEASEKREKLNKSTYAEMAKKESKLRTTRTVVLMEGLRLIR